MLGYFPEGVMYGPQSQDPDKFSLALILQFGGTSGSGFLSQPEVDAAEGGLQKVGEFKKGGFRLPAGPLLPAGLGRTAESALSSFGRRPPLALPRVLLVAAA